jgi:hypothetical protein
MNVASDGERKNGAGQGGEALRSVELEAEC